MKVIAQLLILGSLIVSLFPVPVFASVLINEFLANPSGPASEEGEWVELYNADQTPVDVSGWKLDDADGGSDPYIIATGSSIAAGGYLVFEKSVTNIALNNNGDMVRVLHPNGELSDAYAYTNTAQDISFGRKGDGNPEWYTCLSATKGGPNNCPIPTSTPTNTTSPTKTPTTTPTIVILLPTAMPTRFISPTKLMYEASPAPTDASIAIIDHDLSGDILGDIQVATGDSLLVKGMDTRNQTRSLAVAAATVAMGFALLSGVFIWRKKDALRRKNVRETGVDI